MNNNSLNDTLVEESRKYFGENPNEFYYFKLIKLWKEEDDVIQLSYLIPKNLDQEIKYFLNRQRKSRNWDNERGVEIPLSIAKDIGRALYCALPIRTMKTERKGNWFFDLMKSWEINGFDRINLKLMYNNKGENRYFLNRQHGMDSNGNERGVEIPLGLAKLIGSKMVSF